MICPICHWNPGIASPRIVSDAHRQILAEIYRLSAYIPRLHAVCTRYGQLTHPFHTGRYRECSENRDGRRKSCLLVAAAHYPCGIGRAFDVHAVPYRLETVYDRLDER